MRKLQLVAGKKKYNTVISDDGNVAIIEIKGNGGTAFIKIDSACRNWVLMSYWRLTSTGYAQTPGLYHRSGSFRFLHRELCESQQMVDHINRDKLDNRRSNLRPVTPTQSSVNTGIKKEGKTSKYKGVYKNHRGKYVAQITVDGKAMHLGTFTNEIEAGQRYNSEAKSRFGEYAFLNDIS